MSAEEEEEETTKIGGGGAFEPVPAQSALGVDSVETEHGSKEEHADTSAATSAAAAAVEAEDTEADRNANAVFEGGPPSPGRHPGAYYAHYPYPPPPHGMPPHHPHWGPPPPAAAAGPPPFGYGYGPPPPPGWRPPPGWQPPPPGWRGPPPAPPHLHHHHQQPTSPGGTSAAAAAAVSGESAAGTQAHPGHGYGHWGAPYPPPFDGGAAAAGPFTGKKKRGGKKRTPTASAEKRARKNDQARARAAHLRERIAEIEKKPVDARTEDDLKILEIYEERRRKKNARSRERAIEKKAERDAILAKPEKRWTIDEREKMASFLGAKKRKNEGDRIRRERMKKAGIRSTTKGASVSVRGRSRRTMGPDGQPIPGDSSIPYVPGITQDDLGVVSPVSRPVYASPPSGSGDAPWMMPSPQQLPQPRIPALQGESDDTGSDPRVSK